MLGVSIRALACALFMLCSLIMAKDTSIVIPTTAAPSATPLPSGEGYEYAGCWNETAEVAGAGGVRALVERGNSSTNNTMTIGNCLEFCSSVNAQYAGLEYGRECYCSEYISSFSEQLDDSNCSYACNGNASEVCGGRLTITLYKATSGSAELGWRNGSQATWYALAVGFFLFAAVL